MVVVPIVVCCGTFVMGFLPVVVGGDARGETVATLTIVVPPICLFGVRCIVLIRRFVPIAVIDNITRVVKRLVCRRFFCPIVVMLGYSA